MEISTGLSLIAIFISVIALLQSFAAHESTITVEIKKELDDKAKECNKFIIPDTQGHTNINQEVSAIVTAILQAKELLKMQYKDHWLLLATYKKKRFAKYFCLQLHSSIIELIKNPLHISNYDPATSPVVEKQHAECREFFQNIIYKE